MAANDELDSDTIAMPTTDENGAETGLTFGARDAQPDSAPTAARSCSIDPDEECELHTSEYEASPTFQDISDPWHSATTSCHI